MVFVMHKSAAFVARYLFLSLCGLVILSATSLSSMAQDSPAELKIIRVTPQGDDVPTTRQIVIEFNRAVVPIGKMDRTAEELGVAVTPATKCQWRWLNTSSLACQLDGKESLKKATKYTLTIEPKITAEDGGKINAAATYDFSTERPTVRYTDFQTWKGPGNPVIRVVFSQPVAISSVKRTLSFLDKKTNAVSGVVVSPDETDRELPLVAMVPNEKKGFLLGKIFQKNDNQTTQVNGEEARRIWVIEPEKSLPEDSDIEVTLAAGLISAEGPEIG
jgi:hypothetical protein